MKATDDTKLAKLLAKQASLNEQIAKQKKIQAERLERERAAKLQAAGAAVEAAGLLNVEPDKLTEILKNAAASLSQ